MREMFNDKETVSDKNMEAVHVHERNRAIDLSRFQHDVHSIAVNNGFWVYTEPILAMIPLKLALIHSEVTEALVAHRNNEPIDKFAMELADIIIRVLDLAEYLHIDMQQALEEKADFNQSRPFRHGKRY